ncbi:MAG TPA: ABC transporter substrate-binding protein [Candidatus Binatia bacterium]|nr:ABC transporter substrate-binding protein [Candidatus Binatia bacterium]
MKQTVERLLMSLLLSILVLGFKADLLAAPGEVIITHASMSTSAIPLWVAQRQNFFGKYGVKSKVVWVRGNPAQIATLASGDTQIAYGGATTALAAAVGGKELQMVASLSSRENLDLVARPGINTAKDLRGKRFGIQSIGGGVWKTATVWLEHFGMDEKRDNIQMIVIGDVTILSQALETGRIDATVVPGFLSRRLAEKGFVVLGRCEETRLPSVGMTILVEKPYLQQNMDTLQDALKAIIEGMVFISSSRNKPAVLETITKQFKLSDPAAAEGAYQDVFTLIRLEEYRKPYVSMDGLKTLQRLMKNQNPRIGDIKVENLVDSSVLKKIDDSGFFERLYAEYKIK